MRKKDRISHFRFNKKERNGMFFLLAIIVVLQVVYFYLKIFPSPIESSVIVDKELQEKIEASKLVRDTVSYYPFNPNFISDYKGYVLGMSIDEIDRLTAFRAKGNFVNTISEFQRVTLMGDSLLNIISPFFKFPEWTKEKATYFPTVNANKGSGSKVDKVNSVRDLNTVSAEELKIVHGIGDKLSVRIIKFRDRLGGFLEEDQLYHVYGLKKEVVLRILKQFKPLSKPEITKININKASSDELAQLIYIPYSLSKAIVAYRERNGDFQSFEELTKIEGFPAEKIDIIQLYLSL